MEAGQAVFTWDFCNLVTRWGESGEGWPFAGPHAALEHRSASQPHTCLGLLSSFSPSFHGTQGQVCRATQVVSLFLKSSL